MRILAERGDALILLNRSESKAINQRTAILNQYPDLSVELITADFMDLTLIKSAIGKILGLPGHVKALYNNAGILTGEKILSAQGFESHFAINTLAPYRLIRGLEEKMARPSEKTPSIIVNFASSAVMRLKALDLENLANPATVGGLMSTYAQSKLAVTTLVSALADQLKSKNILIRAIDPGATKSSMTTGDNSGMPKLIAWLAPLLFSPADRQAAKVVDSASVNTHSGRTGIYISNGKEKPMPAPAADHQTQKSLLSMIEKLGED